MTMGGFGNKSDLVHFTAVRRDNLGPCIFQILSWFQVIASASNVDDEKFYLGIIAWYTVDQLEILGGRSVNDAAANFLAWQPSAGRDHHLENDATFRFINKRSKAKDYISVRRRDG